MWMMPISKILLDEAISYKMLKDRQKGKKRFPVISEARYQRDSDNKHGESLQDLKAGGSFKTLPNGGQNLTLSYELKDCPTFWETHPCHENSLLRKWTAG